MYHYSKKRRNRKIWGIVLVAPLILVVVASFFGAIYASYNNIQNLSWAPSIILGVSLIMYFFGIKIIHGS